MARGKRYQPEQVVNLLRRIEVSVANGKTTAQACKEAEIVAMDCPMFPSDRPVPRSPSHDTIQVPPVI